ncbi:CCA tRNA nucleotidyltransferase, partial [Candidatus Bathyarchaeota archaeon]
MERSVSEGRRLYRDVLNEVLKRIRPSAEERERTLRFAERLVCILKNRLKESGIEADVELQGSIAKDTWLAGEKDIDIFILLPRTYSREIFGKVLNVVKSVVGEDWKEAYAEHPYIQAKIGDFTVDCVPCFRVSKASDVSSSVDRTPLHTRYVREKLNGELKNQVRMLKRFMKGIGTYGAEIKIGGFSGYLCELLTLYYGSFMNVLEAASSWRRGEIIDIEGYYQGNEEKVLELFKDSPLIVIDPTDKSRNVASSVRECKLSEFIAASRMFLRKPSITYFYPREIRPLSLKNLKNNLQKRGTSLLIIKFNALDVVSDVLWGQLYKSLKAVSELLASHDFRILRQDVWSDEKEFCLFIFEMESLSLPPMKKHLGPPINKVSDCER